MSLERIIEKILAEAGAEADRITAESREKAEGIKHAAGEEAGRLAARILQAAEREGNLEASRILTQARLEKRVQVLSRKRELVEEVLRNAMADPALSGKGMRRTIVLKKGEREEDIAAGCPCPVRIERRALFVLDPFVEQPVPRATIEPCHHTDNGQGRDIGNATQVDNRPIASWIAKRGGVECRNERCALTTRSDIPATEVTNNRNSRQLCQTGAIDQLNRVATLRPMANRLAMAADRYDACRRDAGYR